MTEFTLDNVHEARLRFLQQLDTEYAKNGLTFQQREEKVLGLVARSAMPEGGLVQEQVRQAYVDVTQYFKEVYGGMAVPSRQAVTFVRIFGDAYAVELEHPWVATLQQLDEQSSKFPQHLRVHGLPEYLWAELPLRQQNLIIRRTQECQVHFARLRALEEPGTPYLSLAAADLRQAAYSACAEDYNAARWSALHACEKILKAVIQAHGETPKKTHTLEKLVNRVKHLTGLQVTPSRFDGLKYPAQLRYSEGSSYLKAERTFLQALRILSFVFPVLQSKHGYRAIDWANFSAPAGIAWFDKAMCVSNYPGFASSAYWQKPFTGLYGAPIQFEKLPKS